MTVEQIIEQMDRNIKLLNESLQVSTLLHKSQVKKMYGSIKTYNECVSMERGALTSLITFRQWIINNCPDIKQETYEELLERTWRKD